MRLNKPYGVCGLIITRKMTVLPLLPKEELFTKLKPGKITKAAELIPFMLLECSLDLTIRETLWITLSEGAFEN